MQHYQGKSQYRNDFTKRAEDRSRANTLRGEGEVPTDKATLAY